MKRCTTCKELKSIDDFGRDVSQKDQHAIYCRSCARIKGREGMRRWIAANLERSRQKTRDWRREHPELARRLSRESQQRSRERHPERNKECKRRRWINNPEKVRAENQQGSQRYKARRRGARVVSRIDFEKIKTRDKMRCHLCRKKVRLKELHFDHVIPLAKGGAHSEENLAVSHAKCNLRKQDRLVKLF